MKIHSIFESISGEAGPVIPQGAWTTFIRMQGCNLNCNYCDTKDSQNPFAGSEMSVQEIVKSCYTKNILITGGEPFSQPEWDTMDLIETLLISGHTIQIETNGTFWRYWPLPAISDIGYCVDVKCPCSGMSHQMLSAGAFANAVTRAGIFSKVDVKFVVNDIKDVHHAMAYIKEISLQAPGIRYIFSPLNPVNPSDPDLPDLMEKVVENIRKIDPKLTDRLIISLQIHKILQMP